MNYELGEFRIPGQPRANAWFCPKTRLMQVTSQQEEKQTWENCVWVAEKKKLKEFKA